MSEWDNATPATVTATIGVNGESGRRPAKTRGTRVPPTEDRQPPHSDEAEQGVLGCVMLDPMNCLPRARKRLKDEEGREFYDLKHREIWLTLLRMYDDRLAGKPLCSAPTPEDTEMFRKYGGLDLITIHQRLKDYQKLEGVGGLAYLAALPDKVPSAANIDYYLEIVAEKFTVRETITFCSNAVRKLYDWSGQVDHFVHSLQDELAIVARLATPPEAAERMYLKPGEFGDEHWDRWFGAKKGVPGLPLPEGAFGPDFHFLIREGELTLLFGQKGQGKSTIASYITLHVLPHWKAVYDSREVHRVETLKKFCNQLMGVKELEHTEENERRLGRAVGWLHSRLLINRTTGIKHWRDILDVWRELAVEGYKFFVLDNLMRIGVAEDDFDGQRAVVTELSTFAIDTNSAVWLLNHSNKGNEGDYRQRSAGHHSVVDNCHNVVEVTRNSKKWEKFGPWLDRLKDGTITQEEFEAQEDVKKFRPQEDAKFYVHAQRLDGTRQNASRELWFKFGVGQYWHHRDPMPEKGRDWLSRWSAARGDSAARAVGESVTDNWPKVQEVMDGVAPASGGSLAGVAPGNPLGDSVTARDGAAHGGDATQEEQS